MLNCKQCGCLVRESRYAKHLSTRCPRTAASLLQRVRDRKRCKYCGQLISITAYQQHLEQVHATQNCKCNHCGLIVQLPKYSHHVSKECLGALTRNCKYCGDPVVELYYERHIRWHETARSKRTTNLSGPRDRREFSHTSPVGPSTHVKPERVTGRQTRFTVATAVESQCQDLPLVTVVATSREV